MGWRHATGVIGTKTITRTPSVVPAGNEYWAFSVSATEDASYQAWIADKSGRRISTVVGNIRAYYTPLVRFPSKALAAGCYSFGIKLTATMNAARQTTLTPDRFCVAGGGKKKKK